MTEKKTAEEGYELIPMSEITDEAREIAVRWMECNDKDWIGQKHKLASDIMNYAKKYAAQQSKMPTEEKMKKRQKDKGDYLREMGYPPQVITKYQDAIKETWEWLRNQIEK